MQAPPRLRYACQTFLEYLQRSTAAIRDFKIVDNGRLRRLDAYTGDLGRVR